MKMIRQIEEGVAEVDNTLRDLGLILHILRKPNSLIALLFIQNNS